MNEEIVQKMINEIKPNCDAAWKALQDFEESVQWKEQQATHEKLIHVWCELHKQVSGLQSLLPKV